MTINVKNLINKIRKEHEVQGIPFMEGRTAGTLEVGRRYDINDFGFINGDNGEYVVVSVKDNDKEFFFGGMVLTQIMKDIQDNYSEDEVAAIMEEGLPIQLDKVKSKTNKRTYTKVQILEV